MSIQLTATDPIQLTSVRVAQREYSDKIQEFLSEVKGTEKELIADPILILVLCPLLQEPADEQSPIFVLPVARIDEAREGLSQWTEHFQSVHPLLPALTMQYAWALLDGAIVAELRHEHALLDDRGPDAKLIVQKINSWDHE